MIADIDNLTMLTVGINLRAQPSRTWSAAIAGENGKAELVSLQHGLSDNEVVDLSMQATIVGVNCPFGWPRLFVEFLTIYPAGYAAYPAGYAAVVLGGPGQRNKSWHIA